MTRRLNRRDSADRWSSPPRDEGGHFLKTEQRRRIRLTVVVALVVAVVLGVTALVARRDEAPQIELIDVEASSAIVSSAVTTTPPATTSTTAPPSTTTTSTSAPVTTTSVAPPATFVPASAALPSFDAADFPGAPAEVELALVEGELRVRYPVRIPTAEEPLRVYVGGDSLSDAPRVGLERAGALLDVRADTRISTGLVADWYFDWVDRIQTEVALADHEIVVLTFGGNDAQPIGGDAPVGTDEWRNRYAERVEAVAAALAGGPQVVWIGLPPVTPDGIQVIVPVVNEVLREAALRWDHIDYLDAESMFTGPEGGFVEVLADADGDRTLVRAPDGVHYTPAAGDWLAERILELVAAKMDGGSPYPISNDEG